MPHFDDNRKKLEKIRNKLRREGKQVSKIHKGKNNMYFFVSEDNEKKEPKPEPSKFYKRRKRAYY